MPEEIRPLDANDFSTAVAATSRAFWPDPMFGFFARTTIAEHHMVPYFMAAVMGDALRHGVVDCVMRGDRVVGTASWLEPGGYPRTTWRENLISARSARALLRGRNRRRAISLLNEMTRRHPEEPHWYLAILGVDPAFQGTGIGRSLLEPRLARCDETGVPAYLETQKPDNVPYYERFGFVVRSTVEHHGCPPLWTMWRDPR